MSRIILFLRVFGKQNSSQTTGEFKNEVSPCTKDNVFVSEVEAFAKATGIIPATEVIDASI